MLCTWMLVGEMRAVISGCELLRNARRHHDTAGKVCGPPGSLAAWADGVCAALQPHGFTAADVGAMVVRRPPLLEWQPASILGCFQAMCAALISPMCAGTTDSAAAVRRACRSYPRAMLSSGTLPALLESYVAAGVACSEDRARALLLSSPAAMNASEHRPWQVRAAIDAAGAPAEAAWPALRGNYSIESRVLPRLLWHCQLPCAPLPDSRRALASSDRKTTFETCCSHFSIRHMVCVDVAAGRLWFCNSKNAMCRLDAASIDLRHLFHPGDEWLDGKSGLAHRYTLWRASAAGGRAISDAVAAWKRLLAERGVGLPQNASQQFTIEHCKETDALCACRYTRTQDTERAVARAGGHCGLAHLSRRRPRRRYRSAHGRHQNA